MRKFRLFLATTLLAASTVVVTATPAGASSCGLPKPGCLVYYKVCQVAYEADLFQCID